MSVSRRAINTSAALIRVPCLRIYAVELLMGRLSITQEFGLFGTAYPVFHHQRFSKLIDFSKLRRILYGIYRLLR
jgi:hypothetical protein